MKLNRRIRRKHSQEAGYILLAVMLLLTMLLIAATITAPRVAQQVRRDREQELIERGKQYATAIKRFYKKFGRYPNRIEELENTNNLRFLRRRYKDPMTESGEWRLIRLGEATVTPNTFGQSGRPGGLGTPAGALPGGQQPQQPGTAAAQISRPAVRGQTLGGAPIVGVASTSEKRSIRELNGKSTYKEWEFVYDPRFDPTMQQQAAPGQQPGQQPGRQPGQPKPTPLGPTAPQAPGPPQ